MCRPIIDAILASIMSEMAAYDYELSRELIAQRPVTTRSDARLMVVDRSRGSIDHHHVRDLPELLRADDCLVLNDSRVIPARLVGRRSATGGRWEGLFLEGDPKNVWRVFCKTRGRLAARESVMLVDCHGDDQFELELIERDGEGGWLVRAHTSDPPLVALGRVGRVPLPHYIRHGEMLPADVQRYQTVYAARDGSVAAPTAGLHFTPELLDRVRSNGTKTALVTLHVGPATFRPITVDVLAEHPMHSEWGELDAPTALDLQACRDGGGRLIAVGTTSVRVLETAAAAGRLAAFRGRTDLFIRPPYNFRAVDALLTNFHLPRTTLLVLVRCFGGDALIRRAYEEAIDQRYRFFSYGDAMLII